MKKSLSKIALCMAALFALLTLTACGAGNNNSAGSSSSSSADSSSSAASSSVSTDSPATGKFATIADFVADPTLQSQLNSIKESLGESMNIEIKGQDNKLIYEFTFPEGTDTEGAAESLATALEGQASTYKSIAASLLDSVEVENPVVVVTYLDSDGNEVYSQEFEAE